MDTSATDEVLQVRIHQQEVVADLGQKALELDDLDELMHAASVAVAKTLGVEYCKVLELFPGGDEVLLRNGVGWREGLVGSATVPTDLDSQAGYTLISREPVVVDDLRTEERFSGPELLHDHDVVSGISVVIGSVEEPWGILGAHTTESREFTEHDANFVQSVANVLASAVENERAQNELEEMYGRISDAFFSLDEEWNFSYLNTSAHDLINPSGRELVGTNIWEAFPDAVGRKFESKYRHAMDRQETVAFEEYYPDPIDAWFEVRAYPSETGLSVYFRDITDRKVRERKLRQSERRYRTLAEQFPDGIVTMFDDDLRYTLAAGKAFEELPVDPDDLEGNRVRAVWEGEFGDSAETICRAALEGDERTAELEYAGRTWQIHVVPVTDGRGAVFAGIAIARDVTDRRARERDLRETKARLEAATEAGAVGTWVWDLAEDRMVTDATFADLFGVDPEAAGDGVDDEEIMSSIHAADRERIDEAVEEAIETGGSYEAEYRVRNADGDVRWVVSRGHVECDAEDDPETFLGAVTDITDRKRAERSLQDHRDQFETLFEVLPVGVEVADADGRLLEVNETAIDIWGEGPPETDAIEDYARHSGRWADTGEPVADDEWAMFRVLEGEELTEPHVYELENGNGDQRIVLAHGMPVRDESGSVRRGVVTLTDVTERREYQRRLEETVAKLEDSNQRLEQFAYAASHDLQEPLRMVSSYLQLLEKRYSDEFDSDAEEFLAFAVDGADRMREMIQGLLAYSRVETRGDPFEPVDLESVVTSAREQLRLQIEEEGAAIAVESLPQVQGDAGQLRQVFQNLLSNALTYSGDESPRVHVSAERAGTEWIVSVHDEGIGIEPGEQNRIFEVFERLHARDEYQGTGIGLALCQRIVERHGGTIWVDSEPGEGSTFSVTLPAARSET
ncbi:PAS domain-containing protein [Natronorubrum texcoconense]|uniref:histidine kinase n=1 Tax=Natronorubrum texcoconense TaxID=1095776 RepID=A0A1G9ECF5_9EURY|nr:PAS domain-containing protein [Natronorubrum texcoconense]SDK73715.1 PAS domain S-box-containing protein [Natronorubrum texcoconense]